MMTSARTLTRRFTCHLLATVPLVVASRSYTAPVSKDTALKALLNPLREKHKLPALAAGIVTTEGLQRVAVTGVRKAGTQVEATVNDLWHLGSDTKAMTASLVAMLVEDGKVKWDDSLITILPTLHDLKSSQLGQVTINQLLHHTSGLPANLNWGAIAIKGGPIRKQRFDALREAALLPLTDKPGSKFLYSNLGYVIVGCVIEKLFKKDWETVIQERLFTPLQMTSAGFGGVGTLGKTDQPWPHSSNGTPMPENGPLMDNPPVMGPAGTVHAKLEDWAKFIADHLKGARGEKALLKPESYTALHTPELQNYAKGWLAVQRPWAGGLALSHSGDNTMNHCVVWIAPAKGYATLVCINQGGQSQAADEVSSALIQLHQKG